MADRTCRGREPDIGGGTVREMVASIPPAIARASRWLRPLLRSEPWPSRPLVVVAACLAGGCAAARGLGPGIATTGISAAAWWCGGGTALVAWWLAIRAGRTTVAATALAAAVGCTAAAWAAAQFDLFPAADLAWRLGRAPVPIVIRGTVAESFRALPPPSGDAVRAAAVGPSSECILAVEGVRVGGRWKPASGRAAVVVGGPPPDVLAGTRLRVIGRGLRPAPAVNPGEFDFAVRSRSQRTLSIVRVDSADCIRVLARPHAWSPAAALDRLRRAGVAALEAHLSPPRAGLAAALLLGARESLPREESDEFLVTGTVHVLSISGLHVGLVAAALFAASRLVAVPRGLALALVAAATGAYMVLVGAETPVVRATLLVWLTCLAAASGRRSAALNALALAAIVVLVWRPAEVFSAGAQLSFLSTAVLVGVAAALPRATVPSDPIERLIDRSRGPAERWLRCRGWQAWVLFVGGAAVWAATAPLVAARFHVVSPVGLVLNVLIAPLVAGAMAAGFLCLLVAPVSHLAAGWCGAGCDAALAAIGWLVARGAAVPGGHAWVPGPAEWWVMGWYAALALALVGLSPGVLARGRTWAALAAAWCAVGLVAAGAARLAGGGPHGLRAIVADVGHGCGIVVRSPTGRCLLYDAGRLGAPAAARRSLAGVLWSAGAWRVDTVVISHADTDHFNALPELLDRFRVGTVVVPRAFLTAAAPAVADLLVRLRARGIPVLGMDAGDAFALDPLCRVRALQPPPGPTPLGTPDNESSLVLAVEAAGRRLLLTGDLEGEALCRLVRAGPGSCDVLVAPHHGSRTSLPADIAAATRPACVVVSGAGGPSWPQVRAAYAAAAGHAEVLLTGGSGAVEVELTAAAVAARRHAAGAWRPCFRQADAAAGRVRSQPAATSASWLATYPARSRSTPEVKP
ncbi:MAG: ComEC/Rec2 family competence protein [Planctomycetaceae bacterium]